MGSKEGVLKVAAKKIGISIEDYKANIEKGLKYCYSCKEWRIIEAFGKDITRATGINAKCFNCNRRSHGNPTGHVARNENKKKGLRYCRGCKSWQAKEKVPIGGMCKPCRAKDARARYKNSKKYRHERIQHARSRARGTDKIPFELCEKLTTLFNGCCVYCGDIATGWDHVTPISKGGGSNEGNIVPACRICNSSKKNNNVFTWLAKVGKVPHILFESVVSINH